MFTDLLIALPGCISIVNIIRLTAMLASTLFPMLAMAEIPKVVSDIPTTHALVSAVMGDLGEPILLMQSSASPHDYALRPSQAASLETADIVFWTSAELTPWLNRAIRSIARDTRSIELMKSADTTVLGFRNAVENSDKHEEENTQSTHQHDHDSPTAIDPHGWLDPVNAQGWLRLIATELTLLDPDNKTLYHGNADTESKKIAELITEITEQLHSVRHDTFIVFHDSYHYFENRFNLHSTASISLADGEHPSIKRLNSLRALLAEHPGACVFAEPQFSDRLIKTITRGQDVSVGLLDPLGAQQTPGPSLYRQVIKQLADSISECLATP